ncbi:MAG TPA: hypothetical protein ENN80_08775 [Candidatus Hydrogenedentes bacterium]|nr:hypothetical protein [Candidatus Hydrogenedentota bacterium]
MHVYPGHGFAFMVGEQNAKLGDGSAGGRFELCADAFYAADDTKLDRARALPGLDRREYGNISGQFSESHVGSRNAIRTGEDGGCRQAGLLKDSAARGLGNRELDFCPRDGLPRALPAEQSRLYVTLDQYP